MKDKWTTYAALNSSGQLNRCRNCSFRHFFIGFAYVLLAIGFIFGLLAILPLHGRSPSLQPAVIDRAHLDHLQKNVIQNTSIGADTQKNCTYYTCFDVYKCSHTHTGKIGVYIYPLVEYVDQEGVPITRKITQEFYDLLRAIVSSKYYTSDPSQACLFIPSIDLLNQNRIRAPDVGKALSTLAYWNNGRNHLLFNILPGSMPLYTPFLEVDMGSAMLTSGGFSSVTFRPEFDISIPVFSPLAAELPAPKDGDERHATWLVVSTQSNIGDEFRDQLAEIATEQPHFLLLDNCPHNPSNVRLRCRDDQVYSYPEILLNATFCLAIRGVRLGQPVLMDLLASGCIPILISDTYVLPFSEVIDWKRAVLQMYEADLPRLMDVVHGVSQQRIREMRRSGRYLYDKYFSSMEHIALSTLRIMNDRVFPHQRMTYSEWNDPPEPRPVRNSFVLPMGPPRSQGFTAVVLTYDRLESLFRVLERLAKAPSLTKMVVVWNNQQKEPPPIASWPRLPKPLQIVRTKHNQLSNRFYPYPEIETDAILAMDDDIVMLTTDEVEFAFEVWRQFPDRIVGFPSRTHVWDHVNNKWKYESEWMNNISMVLTGAAFYHRYYNYVYTTAMPGDIKSWVDDHMNCEDIAMNFLVANMTAKAPIKVTPRKKFKCPECVNMEMLSVDLSHMTERSECINRFASIYGTLPLQSVEFRADPVLYKDNLPDVLQRYKDIGNL